MRSERRLRTPSSCAPTAIVVTLALFLGSCVEADSDTGIAASPSLDNVPARTAEGALVYEHEVGFCEDTDPAGLPYPGAPPRPLWSSIEGVHYDYDGGNGFTTVDGGPSQRVPDYRNVSNNLAILESLQFLLSTISNITGKVEDAQAFLESDGALDDALGNVFPQVQGNCVCLTGGCSPDTILDEVDDAIQQLVGAENISAFLQSYLDDKVNATIGDLQAFEAYLLSLGDPSGPFATTLSIELVNALSSEITTADGQLISGINSCADAIGDGTLNAAIQAAVATHVAALQADVMADVQVILDALTLAIGTPAAVLNQLQTDVVTVLAFFEGVQGIGDLVSLDWAELGTVISNMVPYYEGVVTDVQDAIDAVTAVYNDVLDFEARVQQLLDDILADLAAAPGNVGACMAALQTASNFTSPLSYDDGAFLDALGTAFTNALDTQWQDILDQAELVYDNLINRINGIGLEDALSFYLSEATDIQNIISGVQTNCYLFGTRGECFDHCAATSATANDDFIWLPVDFLQDPAAAGAGAASAGLFVLEQTGWLDQVRDWVQTQMESDLGAAFDTVLTALGNIAATIQQIMDFLGNAFEYINHFSEGYHLGAYTDLRPDLHQCIPWAGHGAYAQFGSLGNDDFSIGARYGAHQLSRKRRVQVRTGGFGVSAFGHQLTIVPNLSMQLQIDGWKLWNAAAPFGIPANVQLDADTVAQIDVFNVVAMDEFPLPAGTPIGGFLVRALYPSLPAALADPDWPRADVDADWEQRSLAIASLGLNLEVNYPADGPAVIDLPTIPIIPGVLTATPQFTFQVGASWVHQTDLMRDRVQEMINANLPTSVQLSAADFARDMHAMQAPDLSDDNRTAAYVEPGIAIDAFLGFKIFKIRFGAGATIGLSVNIEAGGNGGVVDLNAALAEAMTNSNPPQDAPCEPIWDFATVSQCTNVEFEESFGQYDCEPADSRGSCCLQIQIRKGEEILNYGACVDAWTGIDESVCKDIEFTEATVQEAQSIINSIPPWLGSLRTQLLNLVTSAEAVTITNAWRAVATCASEPCEFEGETAFVLDTGVANITGLSECDQFGYCTIGDEIVYDVTLADCEGDGEDSGLRGTWIAYACREVTNAELVGWQGDGCHPMQQGFPSACGCATTADCATGETCNSAGQCTDGSANYSCVCGPGGACPTGRTCASGACVLECVSDTDCAAGRECVNGGCQPPHGIPTAESVVWGMQNIDAPAHLISTYAMSDLLATLVLTLDLYLEASFKLFGKERKWRLIDFHRGWDLGSTWKGWYQPGLEAIYHDECSDPSLSSPVTNRYPQSTTVNPFGAGTDISGVSPSSLCINGGVCRYPENLPASQASPEDYPLGNAGTVGDLIAWCRDEVPQYVEDPDPSTNEGLVNSVADATVFAEDVAVTVYTNHPICVDGQPWDQWMAGLPPTLDADGNVIDEGAMASYDCVYDDPQTGESWVFPCTEINAQMMAIWGCLDADANLYANLLAAGPGPVIMDPNHGSIFDVSAMFVPTFSTDPVFGFGEEEAYTLAAMLPPIRFYSTFGIPLIGQQWLVTVDACVDTRFNDPAETACECEVDSDCQGEERCGTAGLCETPRTLGADGECLNSDCSPVWEPATCSIVSLQADIGLCCGDGIVQEGEACDDGVDGSDTCTPDCTAISTQPAGACCLGEAQCAEPLTATECRAYGGAAFPTSTCAELEYCGDGSPPPPEPTGACCTGIMCLEALTRADCADLGTWYEATPCSEVSDCPQRGACCTPDAGCFDDIAAHDCPAGATFSADALCSSLACGGDPLGACCSASGCVDAVSELVCRRRLGRWFETLACDEVDCNPAPLGACCKPDGGCTGTTTEEVCTAADGTWSEGLTCDDNPCVPTIGACCEPGGTCRDGVSQGSCESRGGAWAGGQLCAELECRQRLGACCLADGTCESFSTADECRERRGTWNEGRTCDQVDCRGVDCSDNPLVGTRCRECGVYECNAAGELACIETRNACGGCRPLAGVPGEACGDCGVLVCRGEDQLYCVEPVGGCETKVGACCTATGRCADNVTPEACGERAGRWFDGTCDDVGRLCGVSICPYREVRVRATVTGTRAVECGLPKAADRLGLAVRCGTLALDNPNRTPIFSAEVALRVAPLESGSGLFGGFFAPQAPATVATVEAGVLEAGSVTEVPFAVLVDATPGTLTGTVSGACPTR